MNLLIITFSLSKYGSEYKKTTAHGLTPRSYNTATPLLNNNNNDNSLIYRRQYL